MCNTKLAEELRNSQVSFTQILISRAIRNLLTSRRKRQGKSRARITIRHSGLFKPYKLIGSFTQNPWEDELIFTYSLSKNEYFLQVWLSPGDKFLIKHKQDTFLHPGFHSLKVILTQDETGREVNVAFPDLIAYNELREFLGVYFKEPISAKRYFLNSSHFMLPKRGKPSEDRCFATESSFGIADGVSAWRQQGIDSGIFAEEFLSYCRYFIEDPVGGSTASSSPTDGSFTSSPVSLRHTATLALSQTSSLGSSTFMLGHIQSDKLQICNLGDCCMVLVRFVNEEPEVILKTSTQQHSFNTPFQICNVSGKAAKEYIKDSPNQALQYEIKVVPGDILVAGTDGVWDNLFLNEILNLVTTHRTHVRKLAKAIVDLAYEHSISNVRTPFEVSVEETYGPNQWCGGKPDDITVMCAVIQDKYKF